MYFASRIPSPTAGTGDFYFYFLVDYIEIVLCQGQGELQTVLPSFVWFDIILSIPYRSTSASASATVRRDMYDVCRRFLQAQEHYGRAAG